jgi:lipoate-protein ligase B
VVYHESMGSSSNQPDQRNSARATRPPDGRASAKPREAVWVDLGVDEYAHAYGLQVRLHDLREAGHIPDTVLLVEHPPSVTIGRASRRESIVASDAELRRAGVAVYQTDRGGDVTYHGPGQLILYPIMNLHAYGKDVHAHARRLEQVLIDTLASFGVDAGRRTEYPGVWTAEGKIGAIGLRVSRWVTLHGIALNVAPDMAHFSLIVPCGIRDAGVTSLSQVLGRTVETAAVKTRLRAAFEEVFSVRLIEAARADVEG